MFTAVISASFLLFTLSLFVMNNFDSAQAATTSLSAVCWPSSANIPNGGSATWYVMSSGGTGTYTYSWSGSDALVGTGPSVLKKYSTLGAKTASVKVTSGTANITANCSTTVISGTVAPSSVVNTTVITPVTSATKATAVTASTQSTVGPTCGAENETPGPCEVIIVHGLTSTGEFSSAVRNLPIVANKSINFFDVPLSLFAIDDMAASMNSYIRSVYPVYPEPEKKILVVAHSHGTIVAYNHRFNNSISYLLYDPPYETVCLNAPACLADLPAFDWLAFPAMGGEITLAAKNGIASSPYVINWSDGYKKYLLPGSDPAKLDFNKRQKKLHLSFDYSSYLPDDTLEVAKRKAIASMSRTTAWINENCPNKDVDVTAN